MNLKELFLLYFEYYKNTLSHNTYVRDLSIFNKHIKKSFLGDLEVEKISFLDLQKYFNYLLEIGYKPKTAKNINAKIKRVLDLAIDLNIINKNVACRVKFPKFDNKIIFDKDYETMLKIIKVFSNENISHSLYFFFLLHGRRKSEVLNLKWKDINFKKRTYTIRQENNKIKKNMIYFLTDELYFRLLNYFHNTDFYKDEDYIFTNPTTKTKYSDLRRAYKKILKDNDLEHMRIHDFRHLVASFSINYLNADINLVSNLLGHTNITTTTRYITINQQLSKNILENIFKRAKNEEQN